MPYAMALDKVILVIIAIVAANASVLKSNSDNTSEEISEVTNEIDRSDEAFDGVYSECFLYLSYSCLQKKTLLYLRELNKLNEVSVIGEYVKFVKVNKTEIDENSKEEHVTESNSEELSEDIDNAVNKFFDNHVLRFKALGKDIAVSHTVDEFVGRKKRKGGGGGGGHDDGKKKMMMMAMMCMKMKMMMMIPGMMGMMGMMSFKGMMFSMMSFMISKMMLLMKILEKKGGGGGAGGGGGDGWGAGGGGGGAWMPAGGQDYGGGGGYDANGQWQSRSIIEEEAMENKPIISYVTPIVRYNNNLNGKKPLALVKNLNDEVIKVQSVKSRKKRGIIDVLQNAYTYWMNRVLGGTIRNKSSLNYPKYKIINGVKYVYYPFRYIQKAKKPKVLNDVKVEDVKTILAVDDFNKGEIVEGPVESRMHKKKLMKMKDNVNETVDENPWE